MAKHEKSSGSVRSLPAKLLKYPAVLLFAGFLLVMIAADCITPYRASSELENTTFIQRPTISVSDVLGSKRVEKINRFFTNYTTFVKQQFAGRDKWIDLQSLCESLVFQKTDYGNVVYGEDSTGHNAEYSRMFGLTETEQTYLPRNIEGVAALGERYPGKVYALIAPSASLIYSDDLPAGTPMLDENAVLDDISAQLSGSVTVVDTRETLTAHRDEYIFYRTDHHWTTDGAYYGYEAFCSLAGLTPFDRSAHTAVTVEDFHGTNYSKCRQWNVEPDTLTYYPMDNELTIYKVTGADTAEVSEETGLYDTAKLDTYDKYAAFLHGNNGYSRIHGNGTGSILIIKDSYANCFAPYLTENYENIDIVDLRSYNYGMDSLIQKNNYDAVLILYNFASFKSDANLYKVGIEG